MIFALHLFVRNVSFTAWGGHFAKLETRPDSRITRFFLENWEKKSICPYSPRVDTISRGVLSLLVSQPCKQRLAGRNSWTDREQEVRREPVDSNSYHISRTQLITRTQLIARPPREIVSRRSSSSSSNREKEKERENLAPARLFSLFSPFSRDIPRNYYFTNGCTTADNALVLFRTRAAK